MGGTDDEEKADPARVVKQLGATATEQYLGRLANRSFLSLWCFPTVYRDQGKLNGGDGKEICDLIVVFGEDIVLFSDKSCAFPSTTLQLAWTRWFKKAIFKSAQQLWGAVRWIKKFPKQVFLDRACVAPFPFALPDMEKVRFHCVVVAHGQKHQCEATFGGSGSMMIRSSIRGKAHFGPGAEPFVIGDIDPSKPFVHVLDESSLDIVLRTLTTSADFIAYLRKREAFLRGRVDVSAAGEEELLAFYLRNANTDREHDFIVPYGYNAVVMDEGIWDEFCQSNEREAQLAADVISYAWDKIVEKFSANVAAGTLYAGLAYEQNTHKMLDVEQALRWLAQENRTARRLLATGLIELIRNTVPKPGVVARRVILPPGAKSPHYTFLVFGRHRKVDETRYRQARFDLLVAQCKVLKLTFPEAEHIVGIATEPSDVEHRSEDLVYLDVRDWDADRDSDARRLQTELGIFKELKETRRVVVQEYPTNRRD